MGKRLRTWWAIPAGLALAGALLLGGLPATAQPGGPAIAEHPDGDNPPRPLRAYPGGIVTTPDVVYRTLAGYRPLKLDVYAHAGATRKRRLPLILFVHGGGWSVGNARASGAFADFPAALAGLARQGYVVASMDYRLSGEAPFPGALKDVKSAVQYLRGAAPQYGIDPERVVVWGASAGGQLAALAGTTCGEAVFAPDPERRLGKPASTGPAQSDCVQGVVAWYGIFDFAELHAASPSGPLADLTATFLGCTGWCADKGREASPTSYVDRSDPPMLLIHGLADTLVPSAQTDRMACELRAAGVPVETAFIPGVNHGFNGKTLAETRAATLEALRVTTAFIRRTVGSDGARPR
ncbi:alpha/beta hydrolase fold domain-containing protein [Novosphingobium sp. BL-52-GroH]|uniref:alpha/beta hydrolase fold domain-containing protein n=1 Tax=Novosphingobium sp. BL-52-GroH TaxID=3349877 RepID=UPI0038503694